MNDHLVEITIISLVGFLLSFYLTPKVGRYMFGIGKFGLDVHKPSKPKIPESGGIGFMVIFVFLIVLGIFIAPSKVVRFRLMMFVLILSLVIVLGIYDDFKQLSALKKPVLLVVISMPVFIFRELNGVQLANPRPILPFVGETRLEIVYWGLAIFAIAIPSNASNMLDVLNGVMASSGILIGLTAFTATFILPLSDDAKFVGRFSSLCLIGVLLGFWLHNKYPAKIFAGDTGSLGVGAIIGLIAVYAEMEFVLIVSLLVHIMNSFSIISSVGGLKERSQMKARPVVVSEGLITASKDRSAPITLVRLLTARKPLTEKDIIRKISILVAYTCLLALLTAFIIRAEG